MPSMYINSDPKDIRQYPLIHKYTKYIVKKSTNSTKIVLITTDWSQNSMLKWTNINTLSIMSVSQTHLFTLCINQECNGST